MTIHRLNPPAKLSIEIELTRDEMIAFKQAVAGLSEYGDTAEMTVDNLMTALAEDIAMTVTRPGCWEAANMQQVFASHGWGESCG